MLRLSRLLHLKRDLYGNDLIILPAGLFQGLTALEEL